MRFKVSTMRDFFSAIGREHLGGFSGTSAPTTPKKKKSRNPFPQQLGRIKWPKVFLHVIQLFNAGY